MNTLTNLRAIRAPRTGRHWRENVVEPITVAELEDRLAAEDDAPRAGEPEPVDETPTVVLFLIQRSTAAMELRRYAHHEPAAAVSWRSRGPATLIDMPLRRVA